MIENIVGLESSRTRESAVSRLVDAVAGAGEVDVEMTRGILEKALALLAASPGSGNCFSASPSRGGLTVWQAKRVATYVSEHTNESLRTSDLAALVQLGVGYFSRAFKVSFQETPGKYVTRQRIRTAQDMMLRTSRTLAEVSLECGFCDQAHFSRLFRQLVGQSPGLWRSQFAPQPLCVGSTRQ
jgi:AraC family transcriptional regulator